MRKYLLAAALIAATPVMATTAVTGFSGGTSYGYFSRDETIGWAFSTANAITVTGLGWNTTGMLASSHQVGIWNSAGTLLGSAFVTPGAATNGIWRFVDTAPITLGPGQYFIGGRETARDGDTYITAANDLVLADGLQYLGSAVSAIGSGFAFPDRVNARNSGGRFGPNFDFSGALPVPEPDSWAMLIAGFGLIGAVARRRRAIAA